jgi:hypothetical protein
MQIAIPDMGRGIERILAGYRGLRDSRRRILPIGASK